MNTNALRMWRSVFPFQDI